MDTPERLLSGGAVELDATNASYAPLNLNEELMRTLFLVAFRLAVSPLITATPIALSSFDRPVLLLLLDIQTVFCHFPLLTP